MGVNLRIGRSKFTMGSRVEVGALKAMKDAERSDPFSLDLSHTSTFEEAMHALGWGLRRNPQGNIRGLILQVEKSQGDEEPLFNSIAPFVDRGSFLEMADDISNEPVRVEFTGKKCRFRSIQRLGDVEDLLEEMDRDKESRHPAWSDLTPPATDEHVPYRATHRFDSGQWVQHPKFGLGYVAVAGGDRIEVVFESAARTLVHGR